MSEWTPTENKPGYHAKTLRRGSCTVVIHRPILAKDEAAKREAQVKSQLAKGLTDYVKRKEVKKA